MNINKPDKKFGRFTMGFVKAAMLVLLGRIFIWMQWPLGNALFYGGLILSFFFLFLIVLFLTKKKWN
jgi:hypothetical protein